jgi:type IV pilus assembly protein PilQ
MVDVEGENVFRTPGISKIPIIGNLFKRKAVARSTSEIIFFITPRINRPDYASPNGSVKRENRTTTILQPVPLGNPPSNSLPETTTQQPTVTPVVPATQPTPQGSPIKPQ